MDLLWRIELLGGLRAVRLPSPAREQGNRARVEGGGVVTRFRTCKTGELLAYLAYYRHRPHPRELLIELLWPESDLDAGRHRLSMALSALRQELETVPEPGSSILVANHFAVGLNPAAVATDVEQFEELLQSAAGADATGARAGLLAEAVALYRGELLPGFYQEWIFPEQQRLAGLYFQALRQLAAEYEAAREFHRALDYALRAVSADRLREEAHRVLMRLYAAAGQPEAAIRQYSDLQRILKQELDTAPGPETRALVEAIRNGRVEEWTPPGGHPRADERTSGRMDESTKGRGRAESSTRPLVHSSIQPGLEPVGDAVPLGSAFYVERPTDEQFRAAIARGDSIVLVKGAQGVGKTSLLARGLQQAREAGARVVLTELGKLTVAQLASAEGFFLAVAGEIADQLALDVAPEGVWHPRRAPGVNLERYLRRVVLPGLESNEAGRGSGGAGAQGYPRAPASPLPPRPALVWGLDEIDRLFECDFGSEVFHLFRAWHNERALDPAGPWLRLTLAIAYATEAHLFITDLNKSLFNVGTRLELEDFTLEETAHLNRRYGAPLEPGTGLERFHRLVGGHPYLVRRGLHELAARGHTLETLDARARSDAWLFGDHLRRIRDLLLRDPQLCAVVRELLQGRPCPTPESFYRLRSAGVVSGDSAAGAGLRSPLYATYLARHLLEG